MQVHWRFRSTNHDGMRTAREDLRRILVGFAQHREEIDGGILTFGELVSNAIRHAPPGTIRVTLDWKDDGAVLRVRDPGKHGFEAAPPGLPAAHAENGRGLWIVAALASTPTIRSGRDGCTVSVDLGIRRQRAA